jgi:outer membrane assembly lipoprotein YfiO
MENKEDIEAEVAYDDFIRLYPADDNIPYALYRKGEVLARQAPEPGRDQSKTLEAVKAFTTAREKSPNGPHAESASAKIRELRNRLAAHENQVVSHYVRRKHYESAEARARRALLDYPDTAATSSLLSLLATALEKQGKKQEAGDIRRSLAEKFPATGGRKP